MSILDFILLLLVSTVGLVLLMRYYGLPGVMGYLLVGVSVASVANRWVPESSYIESIAEFGIVLLMFSIGLEFNVYTLWSMKKIVFGVGAMQVVLTFLIFYIICYFLGIGWQESVIIGSIISLSSTAIVGKMLTERSETNTIHGQEIFGVALFQDIAVVPMLIMVPMLDNGMRIGSMALLLTLVKSAVLLLLMFGICSKTIEKWFDIIARRNSHELFILNILLISVGSAWLMVYFKLPMELGSMMAGLLISDTKYKHQTEEDIKPFRDVLLGLFFVTLGMRVDILYAIHNLPEIAIFVLILIFFKFLVMLISSSVFGSELSTSLRSAIWLSSAGEFGFILLNIGCSDGIISSNYSNIMLTGMLISMLCAPLMIHNGDKIIDFLLRRNKEGDDNEYNIPNVFLGKENHIILIGYGNHGAVIARMLEQEGIQYLAVDNNPEAIKCSDKGRVLFGDGTRRETLISMGLSKAAIVISTISNFNDSLRLIERVRHDCPNKQLIMRSTHVSNIYALLDAGATDVIPDNIEVSIRMLASALNTTGRNNIDILKLVRDMRANHYSIFDDKNISNSLGLIEEDKSHLYVSSAFLVVEGSKIIGKSISELGLSSMGLQIKMLKRSGNRIVDPKQDLVIRVNDKLLIAGLAEVFDYCSSLGLVRA